MKAFGFVTLAWACTAVFGVEVQAASKSPMVIYIQPLLPAPADVDIAAVEAGLHAFYPAVELRRLPAVAMPKLAWYAAQRRWDGDKALPWLAAHMPADGSKILGFTTDDIFTHDEKDKPWGVLGLALGKANIMSTFRAKRGVGPRETRERLAKVAVHEVGHNFGLDHCPNAGCLMEAANKKVATVDREHDLCQACRDFLAQHGVDVPKQAHPPWR